MTNNNKHAAFARRSAIALAISMCFATAAVAQSSEGSIFGRAAPKAQITIVNLDTGNKRQIEAESNGNYVFPKLQPGRYSIDRKSVV